MCNERQPATPIVPKKDDRMVSAAASTGTRWRPYVWLASTILILTLAACLAIALYADRNLTVEAATESTEQAATITGVVVDQMVRDIDAIVANVQTVTGLHPKDFAVSVAAKELWIERELNARPAVRGYAIVDRTGMVVSATFPRQVGHSAIDRPYFDAHREGRAPDLYATDPFISSVTGYRLFLVSWPLRSVDGAFLGVLAISFDTDEIESLIGAMIKPAHDTAALIKSNGAILAASHRLDTQSIDPAYTDTGLKTLLDDQALAAGAGIRHANIFDRSSSWISVVRPLAKLDASIVVARDLGVVLTMWRWRVAAGLAGCFLLTTSILACTMAFTRLLDRQQSALVVASHHALTDPLTGLFNRRMFQDWAATEWSRAQSQGTSLCLLLLDVDRFKQINDTFGHSAGDEVLVGIAGCLRSAVRNEDLIARMGGEEFAVIMPNLSLADAPRFAERLRAEVEAHRFAADSNSLHVTISIGLAEVQAGRRPIETALSAADTALYRAKKEGRNRVVAAAIDDEAPPETSPSISVFQRRSAAPREPA